MWISQIQWTPRLGEILLLCGQQDNLHDHFAVKLRDKRSIVVQDLA